LTCGDLLVFQNSGRPPFWIVRNSKFYLPVGLRGSKRVTMPNFVKLDRKPLSIYGDLMLFTMVAIRHLGFSKIHYWA